MAGFTALAGTGDLTGFAAGFTTNFAAGVTGGFTAALAGLSAFLAGFSTTAGFLTAAFAFTGTTLTLAFGAAALTGAFLAGTGFVTFLATGLAGVLAAGFAAFFGAGLVTVFVFTTGLAAAFTGVFGFFAGAFTRCLLWKPLLYKPRSYPLAGIPSGRAGGDGRRAIVAAAKRTVSVLKQTVGESIQT
ncbi:MAG: hypothetical protein V4614_11385 [Pseudomonadota bacterium]